MYNPFNIFSYISLGDKGPEITWIPNPEPEEDFGLDESRQAMLAARAYMPIEPLLSSFFRQPQIIGRYPEASVHMYMFTAACFMNKDILHLYAPEEKSTILMYDKNEDEEPVNVPIDFDYVILERLGDVYVFEDPEYFRLDLDDPSVLMMEILTLMKKLDKIGIEEIVIDYGAEWMKLLAMDRNQFLEYLYTGSHIPFEEGWDDGDENIGHDGFPKGPYPEDGDDDNYADV